MRALLAVTAAVLATAAVAPATASAIEFSSGLGCSVRCVRSTLATPTTDAARIDVKTDVPARIEVVIRKRVTGAHVATRTSNGQFKRDFLTFVLGLENDTLYEITVSATDAQGRRYTTSGTFRTLKPQTVGTDAPGGGLTSEAGCSAQCIRTAEAAPGVNAAQLKITTNVGAKLEITADPDAPVNTKVGPAFPHAPEVRYTTSELRTDAAIALRNLRSGRRYHVIVRATDANGAVSVRTGVFQTAKRNIRVRLGKIHVSYDGDKGANRGELTFHGGVNGNWLIKRGEDKVTSNSSVSFPGASEVVLYDVPQIADIKVQGVERDFRITCFDNAPPGPFEPELEGKRGSGKCTRTFNTAATQLDLDARFASDPSLPPGFGGAGTINTRITATRGGVRFELDLRIDVRIQDD